MGSLLEDQYIDLLYLTQCFIEWEKFQTKVVEKVNTHIIYYISFFFFRKSCRLWDNVKTYCTDGQATADNMTHAYCMLVAKG